MIIYHIITYNPLHLMFKHVPWARSPVLCGTRMIHVVQLIAQLIVSI